MKLISRITRVVFAASVLFLGGCDKNNQNGGVIIPPKPAQNEVKGILTWNDGAPATGITVSDGYTCAVTDAEGKYSLKYNSKAYYVYYSIPSDAVIETGSNGLPLFFKRVQGAGTYNFSLKHKTANRRVRLIALGDPQVTTTAQVSRFNTETVPDVRKYLTELDASYETVGMTLGDIVGNKWNLFPDMVKALSVSSLGIPCFNTIGNHDHEFKDSYTKPASESDLASNDLSSQRTYEAAFGPVNYSFNIGDCHIISMDNVLHQATASADYTGGVHSWQLEWLTQDLANVPKDKMIILCAHIPWKTGTSRITRGEDVLRMVGQYKGLILIDGHTHNVRYYIHSDIAPYSVHEYVVGTTCGAWWHGITCTDGAPNGYGMFEIDGTTLTNEMYKSTNYDTVHQIRMYKSQEAFYQTGGTPYYFLTNKNGNYDVCANIWNADDDWTITVYEDGVAAGTPTRRNSRDAWTSAYFVNSQGLKESSYANSYAHFYFHKLKNDKAKEVKFVATDKYGHTFEQSSYTTDDDFAGRY